MKSTDTWLSNFIGGKSGVVAQWATQNFFLDIYIIKSQLSPVKPDIKISWKGLLNLKTKCIKQIYFVEHHV